MHSKQRFRLESVSCKTLLIVAFVWLCSGSVLADAPQPLGDPFVVNTYTTGRQQHPSIAMAENGDFVVVWSSDGSNTGHSAPVLAQRFGSDGSRLGGEFRVNATTHSAHFPRVSMTDDGAFVVAWQGGGIQARRFASDGSPIGGNFQVNTYTTGSQRYPDVAMAPDGRFIVVWRSPDFVGTGSPVMRYRRFDSTGAPIGDESVATAAPDTADRAKAAIDAEGNFLITWLGGGAVADGQRFAWDGTDLGALNAPFSPVLAADMAPDGRFVVVSTRQFQRYDSNGAPLGPSFQMSEYVAYPALDFEPGGDFVISWQGASIANVRGQAFTADGLPEGGAFQVGLANIYPSDVARNAEGHLAFAWQGNDGSIQGIEGRRFRLPGPNLIIPTEITAVFGDPVDVPVELDTQGSALASIAFSVDYDDTCLSFDPTDTNPVDGIPDAIDISLPASFNATVFHDLGDTDGELDLLLFADDPTMTSFTDGTIATITFTTTCSPGTTTSSIITPVVFSDDPQPSFGDPGGQDVFGGSDDGSVEILAGLRGDCNGSGSVSAADITACQLETFDGDGTFWADTMNVVPFPGSPVGCDANADTVIDAGDLSCKARLIFGLSCGAPSLTSDRPRLMLPAEFRADNGNVVAAVTLEPRQAEINSLMFSLDYDETRLVFDDVPGAVRFLGAPDLVQTLSFDIDDTDGELDLVMADLSTTQVLREGVLVEIDLRLLEPGADEIEGGVTFSAEPPASFGDVAGRSVPGTAEIDTSASMIFADGFESGDTSTWTGGSP